ncbi:MAG: hypothetical protein JWN66_1047 [Sphingomonas bacterium]|jgi:hypothetical protein|nr:hypothetical protein [Sphingomonas bacterium]MDB5703931.1 hypothetical protein [Sphingomonas bacterium]
MSKSSILYAGFCMLVVGLFMFAAMNGFSPFASGGTRGFVRTAYGPTHK